MKKKSGVIAMIGLIITFSVHSQTSLSVGAKAPEYNFTGLLNSPKNSFSFESLRGKVVIMEFWATWCLPCVSVMEHLDKLRKKFPNDLEVIAVSDDDISRIKKYISKNPFEITFYSDTAGALAVYFPHRTMPHTVVIDKKGTIAAITSPEDLNEKIVSEIINGKEISIPVKKDDMTFDVMADQFNADPGISESFNLQPPIPGAPSITKGPYTKGVFENRRICFINVAFNIIYQAAYQLPRVRTVYEGISEADFDRKKSDKSYLYCLDVISPKGSNQDGLYSYMRQHLQNLDFKIKARLEKRKMTVAVLTCPDSTKLAVHDMSVKPVGTTGAMVRANEYKGNGVTIDEFVKKYLELFGIGNMPIVNETSLKRLYDISFSYDLNNSNSFREAIKNMGLVLKKDEREIEVLIIYK